MDANLILLSHCLSHRYIFQMHLLRMAMVKMIPFMQLGYGSGPYQMDVGSYEMLIFNRWDNLYIEQIHQIVPGMAP